MLTHYLGWTFAILGLAIMGINASFMLISPRLWFRLHSWIRSAATKPQARSMTAGAGGIPASVSQ
jgi:hypothetical protein